MNKLGVFGSDNVTSHTVEVIHGRSLHGIGEPSRKVAFGIGPGDCFWHGDFVCWRHNIAGLGDGKEFVVVFG